MRAQFLLGRSKFYFANEIYFAINFHTVFRRKARSSCENSAAVIGHILMFLVTIE